MTSERKTRPTGHTDAQSGHQRVWHGVEPAQRQLWPTRPLLPAAQQTSSTQAMVW